MARSVKRRRGVGGNAIEQREPVIAADQVAGNFEHAAGAAGEHRGAVVEGAAVVPPIRVACKEKLAPYKPAPPIVVPIKINGRLKELLPFDPDKRAVGP